MENRIIFATFGVHLLNKKAQQNERNVFNRCQTMDHQLKMEIFSIPPNLTGIFKLLVT